MNKKKVLIPVEVAINYPCIMYPRSVYAEDQYKDVLYLIEVREDSQVALVIHTESMKTNTIRLKELARNFTPGTVLTLNELEGRVASIHHNSQQTLKSLKELRLTNKLMGE